MGMAGFEIFIVVHLLEGIKLLGRDQQYAEIGTKGRDKMSVLIHC